MLLHVDAPRTLLIPLALALLLGGALAVCPALPGAPARPPFPTAACLRPICPHLSRNAAPQVPCATNGDPTVAGCTCGGSTAADAKKRCIAKNEPHELLDPCRLDEATEANCACGAVKMADDSKVCYGKAADKDAKVADPCDRTPKCGEGTKLNTAKDGCELAKNPKCGEGTKLNTAKDVCELAKKCDFSPESADTLQGGSLVGAKPAIAALAAAVFALLVLGPHPP